MNETRKPTRNGNRFELPFLHDGKSYAVHVYVAAVGFGPGIIPRKATDALHDWKFNNTELIERLQGQLRKEP